ncbi:MAG: hypothetical protein ACYTG7_26490 [Planctomycetota bacterium]|jgi:hypothetical protein
MELEPDKTSEEYTATIEKRFSAVGEELAGSLLAAINVIPKSPQGPAELARILGIDKVLASRVLKAANNRDPIASLHLMPGPEPLRRFIRASGKRGVPQLLQNNALKAVDSFEILIRDEAGDRIALDAIISAWLPEARAEFELRRKQAAFRATSQLKGSAGNLSGATSILHPSYDGKHIDIVWLFGVLGLQRLRPGSPVKFTSRRFSKEEDSPRLPKTLEGVPVEGLEGLRLDEFCSTPPAKLDVLRVGDVVHYSLADNGFGPRSAADLVFAEANFDEMDRYIPSDKARKRHVFAEISVPVKTLVFDALIHRDIFPNLDPSLVIYDTSLEGVADINDPTRDIDRMAMLETIQHLGWGIDKFRSRDYPRYVDLLRTVCERIGWDGAQFRGYRCRIDYPIYGSQVAMTWDSTPPPAE